MLSSIETYLQQIESALKQGDATEHTHRPFLKTLVEALGEKIIATNEPKRRHGNAPDFIVLQDRVPVGHIEAKDIGASLAAVEKTEQLKRYKKSLNNLLLTNYLDFVWYENGEFRNSISLARSMPDGSVIRCFDGDALLESIFRQFFETEVPIVTSAEDLAIRMAHRARELEASVESVLKNNASSSLRGLLEEFRKELIPDLDDEKFTDLYTQTLAYGLFTACYFTRASGNLPSRVFDRQTAFANLPRSNPFLKRMFREIAGFDLDEEPFVWAVDNLAALLNRADMSEVMEDFGRGKDDPVIHFYETFLQAYDPKLRELRGVYYTPTPVVGYIVRSVDAILKRDFGLKDGLADASKIGSVYPQDGDNVVEAPRFDQTAPATGRVWINSKQYFEDVPTEVWNFHIGGYQVCHKWLKERKGRTLNYDDLTHYKKVVSALSETIRMMAEIDSSIEEHGGFPFK